MPRGDKSKYTTKQKRQAEHIENGYEEQGAPKEEAERRAWATVNKVHHGGEKPAGRADGAERPTGALGNREARKCRPARLQWPAGALSTILLGDRRSDSAWHDRRASRQRHNRIPVEGWGAIRRRRAGNERS